MRNNKFKLFVVILFLFLSCSFFAVKKSFGIYRDNLNTTVNLSILDPSTTFTVNFNTHGGRAVNPIIKTVNQPIGALPVTDKAGFNFLGWFTAETGGTQIDVDTLVTGNITYHAQWAKIVCKKAVDGTLHEETCAHTGNYGCRLLGHALNSTITYGTIPGNNSPVAGDAYDCDVNDDGTFDDVNERFYFMRENMDTNDTAALVFHTNFDENGMCDNSDDRLIYKYTDAKDYLPGSSLWTNDSLVSFDGKVSRFIDEDDLKEACGDPITYSTVNYLSSCQFFLENSRFQSDSLGRSGIWIEEGEDLQRIHTKSVYVATVAATSSNATRPVIEVPMNSLEGYKAVRHSYNITFHAQGGVPATTVVVRYEDQTLGTLPNAPTKEGYTFLGWFDSNDVEASSELVITGNNC